MRYLILLILIGCSDPYKYTGNSVWIGTPISLEGYTKASVTCKKTIKDCLVQAATCDFARLHIEDMSFDCYTKPPTFCGPVPYPKGKESHKLNSGDVMRPPVGWMYVCCTMQRCWPDTIEDVDDQIAKIKKSINMDGREYEVNDAIIRYEPGRGQER